MIRELLRTNRITSFVIIVLEFILIISLAVGVDHGVLEPPTGLVDSALHLALGEAPWARSILSILLIGLTAITLQSVVDRSQIRTTLSLESMFWFIGMSIPFVLSDQPLPILFAQFFLTLAIRRLMALEADRNAFSIAFDSSLLLACAALFNIFYGVGVLVVYVAITTVRTLQWRDVVWSIIGFGLPVYFISAVRYVMGLSFISPLRYSSIPEDSSATYGAALLIFILLSLTLFLLSIWANFKSRVGHNIRKRNVNQIVFSVLGLCVLIVAFDSANGYNGMTLYILALPISLIMVDLYERPKYTRLNDALTIAWSIAGVVSVVLLLVHN